MHSNFLCFFQFNLRSETGPTFSSPAFSTSAFSVLHFPLRIFGPPFSSPAFYYPGNLVPHFPVVSVALWSKWSLIGPLFSGPAFSVDPAISLCPILGTVCRRGFDWKWIAQFHDRLHGHNETSRRPNADTQYRLLFNQSASLCSCSTHSRRNPPDTFWCTT